MKLRSILAVAAIISAFSFSPAFADVADPSTTPVPAPVAPAAPAADCSTLQSVIEDLIHNHEKFVLLNTKDLIGVAGEGLGSIIVSTMAGLVVVGFERNGCMYGPVPLGKVATGA